MSIHSDAEMQIASLMAYMDIPAGMSLGRYMETHSGDSNVARIREIAQSCTGDSHGYDNWRVVGVGDDENASGMYGCMIDDGHGDAIIAFRGSESDQLLEDWGAADFGLMNSTETWQQSQAEEFTRRMYEEFGDEYDSFALTGHSLGGNLAIDAALDAPDGMRAKITQVVGLDSPGFSDEYLLTHAGRIREMEDRITHYQWSGVGAIYHTPGTERTVNVLDMKNDCLSRHDLRNLDTGNGSVSDRPGGMTGDELAIRATAAALDYTGPFNPFGPGRIISGIAGLIDLWNRVTSTGQKMQITTAKSTEANAVFEVNVPSLNALGDKYGEVEANLRRAESDLDSIYSRLKYHSTVGWIIKMSIKNESTRVNSLAEHMKKYKEVLHNVATIYQQADANAAAAYGNVGGGNSGTVTNPNSTNTNETVTTPNNSATTTGFNGETINLYNADGTVNVSAFNQYLYGGFVVPMPGHSEAEYYNQFFGCDVYVDADGFWQAAGNYGCKCTSVAYVLTGMGIPKGPDDVFNELGVINNNGELVSNMVANGYGVQAHCPNDIASAWAAYEQNPQSVSKPVIQVDYNGDGYGDHFVAVDSVVRDGNGNIVDYILMESSGGYIRSFNESGYSVTNVEYYSR